MSSEPNRIRVLRIIARMNLGGPAIQITGISKNIDELQFEQLLLTGVCEKNEIDILDYETADFRRHIIRGLGRNVGLASDFRAFMAIRREMKRFNPLIVHTHTAKAGVLGRLASITLFQQHKRVHTFHGHLLRGYFSNTVTKLVVIIEKILARYTDILISVGKEVAIDLIKAGVGNKEKYRVVPPGVEIGNLPDKRTARSKLGLAQNVTCVMWIGRVEAIKCPERLLEVARLVSSKDKSIRFCVAGDGALLASISAVSKSENLPIDFLGWQQNIEIPLAAADLVILTSANEGTPLSLIQAQLAELPVIATDVGSVSEVVLKDKSGLIGEYNADRFAEFVLELSNNKVLRKEMGSVGKKFASENFSISRLTRDHEKIYLSLVN